MQVVLHPATCVMNVSDSTGASRSSPRHRFASRPFVSRPHAPFGGSCGSGSAVQDSCHGHHLAARHADADSFGVPQGDGNSGADGRNAPSRHGSQWAGRKVGSSTVAAVPTREEGIEHQEPSIPRKPELPGQGKSGPSWRNFRDVLPQKMGGCAHAARDEGSGRSRSGLGTKHKKSTFRKVYESDPSYVAWMQAREWGNMSSQVEFLRYCHFRLKAEQVAFE